MSKRLVITLKLSGHNMEYLHHIYMAACNDKEKEYVIAVPYEFDEKKHLLNWPPSSNVSFVSFVPNRSSNVLKKAWKNCGILKQLIKEHRVDEVIVVALIDFMPFLPLFLPKGISVSGIVYKIYLYSWKGDNWKAKFRNALMNKLYSSCRCFRKVFILNDASAAVYLNKYWNTDHYCYLTDPYMPIPASGVRDLREELNIISGNTVVLHPGSLMRRKGTLTLLTLIKNSKKEDLAGYTFIFAGKLADDIKDEFHSLVKQVKKKTQIIVMDRFLPFDYLGSLMKSADKVVLPYGRTNSSSGIIGYCSQFKTPVYVPNGGILGKLVRKYQIGRTMETFDDIKEIMHDDFASEKYCMMHTVESFQSELLS